MLVSTNYLGTSEGANTFNIFYDRGLSPKDGRGKHNNSPQAVVHKNVVKIKEHPESFPKKIALYSSDSVKFMQCELNVKTQPVYKTCLKRKRFSIWALLKFST